MHSILIKILLIFCRDFVDLKIEIKRLKSIQMFQTVSLQEDLPKNGENFVKETFECARRLARNKVPS